MKIDVKDTSKPLFPVIESSVKAGKLVHQIKFETNPACWGNGSRQCVDEGRHTWFNHAMDNRNSIGNLPEGFVEP